MSKITNFQELEITRINFAPCVTRWHYRFISSPIWRFYWNPTPGAVLFSRGESVELSPETAVLLPPQTPFSTESNKSFSHFYVHFSLPLLCRQSERKIQQIPSDEVISPWFRRNLPEMSGQQLFWAASGAVQNALAHLPETFFCSEESKTETLYDRAITLLDEDKTFSLSERELANRCGTSVNTLRRQFIQATGLSIKKWQLNRKMEKAVQYLLYENCCIKETANLLGFADRYHFSKVFKLYFGISPAQFIKCGGISTP